MKTDDLENKIFGKWEVIKKAPSRRFNTYWLCKCECGKEKDVAAYSLKNRKSSSCGCESKFGYKDKKTKERKKEISKMLKKGYSVRDILANCYTSTRTIANERRKINKYNS